MATRPPVRISVCVPTYNRLPYFRLTLENLVEQLQGLSYEIIVVDGGSSDGTLEYLEELKRKRPVVLINQSKPEGNVRAVQAAFDAATGDYLVIRSDHSFTVIEPVLAACRLMDSVREIDLVFDKMYKPQKRIHKRRICANYFGVMEAFIIRNSGRINIGGEYCSPGWVYDLTLRMLASGKMIGGLKPISYVDIEVDDPNDALHLSHGGGREIDKKDKEYFSRKCERLQSVTEKVLSPSSRFRSAMWHRLLSFLYRFSDSRLSVLLSRTCIRFGYKRPRLLPDPDLHSIGVSFAPDENLHIPYFEALFDWVQEKCCPFSNRNLIPRQFRREFYLVQALPSPLLSAIAQEGIFNHQK